MCSLYTEKVRGAFVTRDVARRPRAPGCGEHSIRVEEGALGHLVLGLWKVGLGGQLSPGHPWVPRGHA